jgi:hypothetical protein
LPRQEAVGTKLEDTSFNFAVFFASSSQPHQNRIIAAIIISSALLWYLLKLWLTALSLRGGRGYDGSEDGETWASKYGGPDL